MATQPINTHQVAQSLDQPWQPQVLASVNGFDLKVARLEGEFPWHVHEEEDELFLCTEGSFLIEIEGGEPVVMGVGDVFVVPAGQRHRPVAENRASALLFERSETKQYGD